MKRTISAVDARKHLGEILEGVFYRDDEVVIERAGKPMAVVIPMGRYESILRDRARLIEIMEHNWEHNKDVPPEELERDVEEAIRAVRAEKRRASA